jgi:hypothetical protein
MALAYFKVLAQHLLGDIEEDLSEDSLNLKRY